MREAALPDFRIPGELEDWLKSQPRETATALAARAALRALPLMRGGGHIGRESPSAQLIVLPVFRAVSIAWTSAIWPVHATDDFAAASVEMLGAGRLDSDRIYSGLLNRTPLNSGAVYPNGETRAIAFLKGAANYAARCVYAAGEDVPVLCCRAILMAAEAVHWAALDTGVFPGAGTGQAGAMQLGLVDPAKPVIDAAQSDSETWITNRRPDLNPPKLWPAAPPSWIMDLWAALKTDLNALGEDWEVWTDWYDDRLAGEPSTKALEIACAMIPDEVWRQGPKVVNAEIKRLIEENKSAAPSQTPQTGHQAITQSSIALGGSTLGGSTLGAMTLAAGTAIGTAIGTLQTSDRTAAINKVSLADLAEVASPAPFIAPDGRLDAGPNTIYDRPRVDDELLTLPVRQQAVIQTINSGLPINAPPHLKTALNCYSDELKIRGVQPILGLLNQMEEIIEAEFLSPDAQDWLAVGLKVAFQHFTANHDLIIEHFPFDPKRNETYANVDVDESKAIGSALRDPFKEVADVTPAAHAAGVTTEDFVKIVDSLKGFAEVISSRPTPATTANDRGGASSSQLTLPHVGADDRILPPQPSETKRLILTGLGFFERAYNLLGTTATLLSTQYGALLLAKLGDAINALSKFVHF